mmetsp:Transcript_15375/g.34950  ORF Transcript_15375/g.34950 Transcript_15375/m.34950 type:complete len:207 (+) Transcript_15375:738-1358(+)
MVPEDREELVVRSRDPCRHRLQRYLVGDRCGLQRSSDSERRGADLPAHGAQLLRVLCGRVAHTFRVVQAEAGCHEGLLVHLRHGSGLLLRAGHVVPDHTVRAPAAQEQGHPGEHVDPEALQAHAAQPDGTLGADRQGSPRDAGCDQGGRRGRALCILYSLLAVGHPLCLRRGLPVAYSWHRAGEDVLPHGSWDHAGLAAWRHPGRV